MTKGGVGKTTAAAHAATALAECGATVLAVDADPQGSLFGWQQMAGLPFAAAKLPVPTLYRELPGRIGPQVSHVVIDTPGTEHGRPIVLGAIRAATHVIIPLAPSPIEYREMARMRALLDEAAQLGARPRVGVLLVKTRSRVSRRVYREQAEDDGWWVLRRDVPMLEQFTMAFGGPIVRASASGYGDAVTELLGGP